MTEKERQASVERSRRRYETLINSGICVRCGVRKADVGYTQCWECRVIASAYQHDRYMAHRQEEIRKATCWEKDVARLYGEEYLLRQLAEEASELCQAALKCVRALRTGETPVTGSEARRRLVEEMADVVAMMQVIADGAMTDTESARIQEVAHRKKERMRERLLPGDVKTEQNMQPK